jgi:rhamnogalacturonyl hydrolase YesR
MRVINCFIVSFLSLSCWAVAQEKNPTREQVLEAINGGARYASQVLLDEHGKSRCDYSLLDGKWFDYEPAWHTGQIINALVEVYKLTKNEQYLLAAKKAGDWWVSLEIKDHPKLKGMVSAIPYDGIDYIQCSTVTDGTLGLFNLYRLTKEKKYAEVPTKAGEWMLQNFYLPKEGLFYDLADPVSGEVRKVNSTFGPEKRNNLSLNDVARVNNEGFLYKDMYEYTGNEKYREVFINLCESLVAKQGPQGLWMQFAPNNAAKGSFHPRFNLWYAESLIEGFVLTGNKGYLEAAKKTLAFYTKYQKKDGTYFYENNLDGRSNENSVTGSTVAMAGLLWIRLQKLGVGDEFKENIERSARWLLANRFAADHPDKNLAGATMNIRTRTKNGSFYLTQRDLGTSFAIRFLTSYHDYRFGAK